MGSAAKNHQVNSCYICLTPHILLFSDRPRVYLQSVGVSAIRGDGISEFFTLVDSGREEFARLECMLVGKMGCL
jgi:hypothetical protein